MSVQWHQSYLCRGLGAAAPCAPTRPGGSPQLRPSYKEQKWELLMATVPDGSSQPWISWAAPQWHKPVFPPLHGTAQGTPKGGTGLRPGVVRQLYGKGHHQENALFNSSWPIPVETPSWGSQESCSLLTRSPGCCSGQPAPCPGDKDSSSKNLQVTRPCKCYREEAVTTLCTQRKHKAILKKLN